MRHYIEEQADCLWKDMKQYILDIKGLAVDALLDEIIKNIQDWNPESEFPFDPNWIKEHKWCLENDTRESLIARAVEEKFYVLDDEEEHEWNEHVVHSVLNGEGWIHRWDNEIIL